MDVSQTLYSRMMLVGVVDELHDDDLALNGVLDSFVVEPGLLELGWAWDDLDGSILTGADVASNSNAAC